MSDVEFRRAVAADLPAVVAMLADDALGTTRESPDDLTPYERAFPAIDADPNQNLVVLVRDKVVIGTLQLTLIPGLSRKGTMRAQIEGVRVHSGERGTGLGTELFEWAIEESRKLGADLVQLTSDVKRPDAHRFYGKLGFSPTHVGFKLDL
ncbi:GNAT family N-acetyltransferase [Modestobacter marinus]|uniref:GNAT family acetyltransferase n=1 Tax=Modestobacter marinus TaxID=477641 RepID=A0ABQ2GCI2_9ACTN|nr:GNAT family N-acetyltransferase [Modestobacter marinus]GGL85427.1 GNAT family acetyltransferase [Modestobacter marinus]